jgi:hypothetical protein
MYSGAGDDFTERPSLEPSLAGRRALGIEVGDHQTASTRLERVETAASVSASPGPNLLARISEVEACVKLIISRKRK